MDEQLYLKPKKAGLVVRNPQRKFEKMPDYGEQVFTTRYWIRRLAEGSVVKTTAAEILKGKMAERETAQKTHAAKNKTAKTKPAAKKNTATKK